MSPAELKAETILAYEKQIEAVKDTMVTLVASMKKLVDEGDDRNRELIEAFVDDTTVVDEVNRIKALLEALRQDNADDVSMTELEALIARINNLSLTLAAVKEKCEGFEKQFEAVNSAVDVLRDNVADTISTIRGEISVLKERIDNIKSGTDENAVIQLVLTQLLAFRTELKEVIRAGCDAALARLNGFDAVAECQRREQEAAEAEAATPETTTPEAAPVADEPTTDSASAGGLG